MRCERQGAAACWLAEGPAEAAAALPPIADAPPPAEALETAPPSAPAATTLDAKDLFTRVVSRYRSLVQYADSATLVQVTTRDGEPDRRVQTRVDTSLSDARLDVRTPGSALRSAMFSALPLRSPAGLESTRLGYQLWLAPHMALRYAQRPDDELPPGVAQGLAPSEVREVQLDGERFYKLELRDEAADGGEPDARFDLYVDPESLLIERIEGHRELPGGGRYDTTLRICPTLAVSTPDEAPIEKGSTPAPTLSPSPAPLGSPEAEPGARSAPPQ